ncbi:hypothetical protein LX64_02725 [Chitinophaga skermanii]|uniref:Uncharacterized protein n=1 Tax=Chitinophaga skermanii TaxID=331697 RepID=A0A327QIQ5_9BACT|nr:hypothetical protein [Chitinophaga skermanii]RAJ03848.1 hypothetical protein LX64_02725 [Chitinophaga skermanii]
MNEKPTIAGEELENLVTEFLHNIHLLGNDIFTHVSITLQAGNDFSDHHPKHAISIKNAASNAGVIQYHEMLVKAPIAHFVTVITIA